MNTEHCEELIAMTHVSIKKDSDVKLKKKNSKKCKCERLLRELTKRVINARADKAFLLHTNKAGPDSRRHLRV